MSLIAEGVGPFQSLELDLSDGKGNPHLGPHILAGVNGSGKSTVLRTIAWVLDVGDGEFPYGEWRQMLRGHSASRAMLVIRPPGRSPYVRICGNDSAHRELLAWARSRVAKLADNANPVNWAIVTKGRVDVRDVNTIRLESPSDGPTGRSFSSAAYSPARSLRYLADPDLSASRPDPRHGSLAFESTVENEVIQSWLLGLHSKRAIAKDRKQPEEVYSRSLERLETALRLIYDRAVSFDVEIEPRFVPTLRMLGQSLNFFQLPDGVRSTVGWVADFMMRQDQLNWSPNLGGRRPGVLLLDEVDAHLHPYWQRRLLPALREALLDVQIIATSHSPFVISSCPGSRVHVLDLDAEGHARVRQTVDAPIGESVTTTLKEIFGVDSRFDILTERELNEWNELKKREAKGALPATESTRLKDLTRTLSERSEELRSLVAAPQTMPKAVLDDLLGNGRPAGVKRTKKRA